MKLSVSSILNPKNIKMKATYLFFDLGSTLIDESEAYKLRVLECIEGSNISFREFDDMRKKLAHDNMTCGDEDAADYFGLSLKPWRNDVEYPYLDAIEVLTKLKEKGYKLAVVANQAEGSKSRLRKWNMLSYFDFVLASFEAGVAKPDKEIFLRAIKKSNAKICDCVMIGDRLDNDIKPAKELGLKTVLIRQGVVAPYQEIIREEFRPDYIVNDLKKLLEIF